MLVIGLGTIAIEFTVIMYSFVRLLVLDCSIRFIVIEKQIIIIPSEWHGIRKCLFLGFYPGITTCNTFITMMTKRLSYFLFPWIFWILIFLIIKTLPNHSTSSILILLISHFFESIRDWEQCSVGAVVVISKCMLQLQFPY
ncbi:MAG: hypothetical protein ACI90V_014368 [Bacillariaceae sp.]|jgi:hypothetical protein